MPKYDRPDASAMQAQRIAFGLIARAKGGRLSLSSVKQTAVMNKVSTDSVVRALVRISSNLDFAEEHSRLTVKIWKIDHELRQQHARRQQSKTNRFNAEKEFVERAQRTAALHPEFNPVLEKVHELIAEKQMKRIRESPRLARMKKDLANLEKRTQALQKRGRK